MADNASDEREHLENEADTAKNTNNSGELMVAPTNAHENSVNKQNNGMEYKKLNSGESISEKDETYTEQKQTSSNNQYSASSDSNHGNHDDKDATLKDALLGNKKTNGINDIVVTMDTREDNTSGSRLPCCQAVLQCLRRKDYLVLILGSVTFLLGCIILAIGVYMMQTKGCVTQGTSPGVSDAVLAPSSTKAPPHGVLVTYSKPSRESGLNPINTTDRPSMTSSDTDALVINVTGDEFTLQNLALGREAYQSSTDEDGMNLHYASLATDGATDYMFSKGSCSRTDIESQPYWYVDLDHLELVKTIKIFLPRDLPAGELHNFEVRIGQEGELSMNPLCRYFMGTALVFTVTIKCERPMYGRYVSIVLLGDDTRPLNRLTLCQVQVYNN